MDVDAHVRRLASDDRSRCDCYWWRIAAASCSSGSMRWLWSSRPSSISAHLIVPENTVPRGAVALVRRHTGVHAQVKSLVEREVERVGLGDRAGADLGPVDVQGHDAAFADFASRVGELIPSASSTQKPSRPRPARNKSFRSIFAIQAGMGFMPTNRKGLVSRSPAAAAANVG